MSDQKVPTAPDYSPIIDAYNAISQHASERGDEAYAWAKDQVANNKDLIDQITKGNLDTQNLFSQAAKDQLASATETQREATDYLRSERDRYRDPAYVQNDMGAAQANVGQAFDAARQSSIRELESFGINPASTRYAGLDTAVRTQRAAAQAAAGTTAARQDQALADAANDKLLGQGNTAMGQSGALSTIGTGAGGAAVSNNLAGTASGANVLGTDLAWTGTRSNALGGAANTMNQQFNNQAKSDEMSNNASSGIGSALGLGASIASKFIGFAEGGAIPDAADGGEIPPEASPSGGAVTDDVPASAPGVPNIRLNGGEFIIPKDVSSWMGEKFFQDMITKARKAMGPAVGGPPGGQPPGGQGPMMRPAAVG